MTRVRIETEDMLYSAELRQSFYSAMNALITRANDIRDISPNMAIEDMIKVGHILHYMDPYDRVELFDEIRARIA